MDRHQRARVDEYVRDFRLILKEDEKYQKYAGAARVDQGCAAMLLGEHRDGAAFKSITKDMHTSGNEAGYGRRKMYALRDLAEAVVMREKRRYT